MIRPAHNIDSEWLAKELGGVDPKIVAACISCKSEDQLRREALLIRAKTIEEIRPIFHNSPIGSKLRHEAFQKMLSIIRSNIKKTNSPYVILEICRNFGHWEDVGHACIQKLLRIRAQHHSPLTPSRN